MTQRVLALHVVVSMCSVAACSGGGGSSGGGTDAGVLAEASGPVDGGVADSGVPAIVGCDAGATASGCGYLNVTLTGGFTASDCCYGCGADTAGFSWMIDQDRASFQVTFPQGQTPLEQTGTFPLDSVLVGQGYGDGGILGWQTPPGACTVTIERSVCVPDTPKNADWLTGSGHCTLPAESTPAKGPAPPVTIGDFTFRGYVLFP
jgi:hypothetical protein